MGRSNNLWSPFCPCYLETLLCQKYLRRIQWLLSCPIPGAAGEEGNSSFWYWGIFPHKRSVGLVLFKAKFWNNLGLPWKKAGPGENGITWERKVQKRIGKRWNVERGHQRHPFPWDPDSFTILHLVWSVLIWGRYWCVWMYLHFSAEGCDEKGTCV